jgi:hypothetical protein
MMLYGENVIYEAEHVKSTATFKWHNGGVTVATIWNVNINWELPNLRLGVWWNFKRDVVASGVLKMPPNLTGYVAGKANEVAKQMK